MLLDARRFDSGRTLDLDVCVVGAGPAGIAVAHRLAAAGARVGLLEAGGVRPALRDQAMLVDAPSGDPYWPLENIRLRMVGGSANRWGGICRPLDPLDLRERPWVAGSGWPIPYEELVEPYRQAARFLDLPDADFSTPMGDGAGVPVDLGTDFETVHYRLSPQTEYGKAVLTALVESPSITLITHANVIAIETAGDTVRCVQARTHSGVSLTVRADRFVLATGGVENARQLLLNDIGTEDDQVGRYFMEHVHAPIARFTPSAAHADWSSYTLATEHLPKLTTALAPSPAFQQDAELLTASIAIGPTWYLATPPFVDWDYRFTVPVERLYRAMSARGDAVACLAARGLDRGRAVWNTLSSREFRDRAQDRARTVYYRGEQAPDPENRVVLATERDSLGQRRAHLQWRVGAAEVRSAEAVVARLGELVRDTGWGTLEGPDPDWRSAVVGGPHHLGTTRMSDDPRHGVVDPNCRVHSMQNLYVAGSSVFTTGGHANPTLSVVALSLRLADHLAELAGATAPGR